MGSVRHNVTIHTEGNYSLTGIEANTRIYTRVGNFQPRLYSIHLVMSVLFDTPGCLLKVGITTFFKYGADVSEPVENELMGISNDFIPVSKLGTIISL